jgi:dinuclear metal center YbgI/SA1388 family protein
MMRLGEVVAALDGWFDPATAEPWDAVGLVCGDPDDPIERILLAVDPVPAVLAEAEAMDSQLIVTHHPLLLSAVHSIAPLTPKGRLLHRLARSRRALHVAHTNADAADPGVSDALAGALGLVDLRPLEPLAGPALDKLGVYVPTDALDALLDALAAAGAGAIGDYDRCAWTVQGSGTFRPLPGASPAIGEVGRIERVPEARLEMVVPRARRAAVLGALHAAHPYETPAYDLTEQIPAPSPLGIGRIGALPAALTLREFTARAAAALPATRWGLRAAGDPERPVRTVAVCGGSGGQYIGAARAAGADAYLTADLRHHVASEAVPELAWPGAPAPMALVDAAHWATESPWLAQLAQQIRGRFGTSVSVAVSELVTDPWTLHEPAAQTGRPRP